MNNEQIRYFSMFTGVGGFELGFEKASQERNTQSWTDSSNINRESSTQGGNKSSFNCGEELGFENAGSESSLSRGWKQNPRSAKSLCTNRVNSSNETTGYICVGFSEIDKYANQLLANKFPEVRNYGDATKINASELPDFDMLCGGFPCQPFSIAGKRRGFQDTRGTMFFHIARILEVKRPKIVFLENVKGLLNHDEGKTFSVILQALSELGYSVQWMVLNSKFFGVPQNRERVFIIGSLRGQPRPEILPFRTNESEITEQYPSEVSNTITQGYYKQGNSGTYIKQQSQGYRVYETGGTSVTLQGQAGGIGAKTGLYAVPYQNMLNTKTKDVNEAIMVGKIIANQENKPVQIDLMHLQHGEIRPLSTYIPQNEDARCVQAGEPKEILIEPTMKIRRLTPTECERLQGFPDGWTLGFSDTQRYKMMGNAVTTNVIKAIAGKLI